jgi:hypothetical protein
VIHEIAPHFLLAGFLLCICCTLQAKNRVIDQPPFIVRNTTSIEVSKANGTRFYQISFELASSDIDIEEQVTETVVQQAAFDGLSNKTILLEEDYTKLGELRECSKELITYYITQYTNNYFKVPIYNNTYDNLLSQFIYSNQLLKQDNTRGIFFLPVFPNTPQQALLYNSSLFKALESNDITTMSINEFYYNENVANTQFEYSRQNILIYDYSFPNKSLIREKLKEYILLNTRDNSIKDIISIYFNETDTIKDTIIDHCKRLDPMDMELNYHLIPILLFILKKVISNIERDGNKNGKYTETKA